MHRISILIAAIAALTMYATAQAQQPLPAVGKIVGTSRQAEAACEPVGGTPTSRAATEGFVVAGQSWLPIVTTSDFCPVGVEDGGMVLLDAETTDKRELVSLPQPESWYVTNVASTLVTNVISPTLDWGNVAREIATGSTPGATMALLGQWPLGSPEPFDPQANPDSPVNWKRYWDGERAARLDQINNFYITIDDMARLSTLPSVGSARYLFTLCQASIDRYWKIEWVGTFTASDGVMFMLSHPDDQLPSVCPHMEEYIFMAVSEIYKYLPRQQLDEIDKKIKEETTVYRRKLWVYPDLNNLTPQPANVVWTATALGGSYVIYARISGIAGGGGNGWLLFTPLTGSPRR